MTNIIKRLCVNGWEFPPSCSFTDGIPQSLYNWELLRLSYTTELSSELMIVSCSEYMVVKKR